MDQLPAAQRREAVIAGAASVGRGLPLAGDPFALEQALQRGIEGAVIDDELVAGLLFEKLRDAVSMIRSSPQAAQNEDFQRTLQELQPVQWIVYRRHTIYFAQAESGVKKHSG